MPAKVNSVTSPPRGEYGKLRIVLNGFFFAIWMVSTWYIWSQWAAEPSRSRMSLVKAHAMRYPTVLVCNPLHYFNLASKSDCHDEFGPWNTKGLDIPDKQETKDQTCLPVSRIVFYTPVGPQFCLKFEAPPKEKWQANLELGTGILKTVIQLLGPKGQEHFFPADSAVIYVIDSPGWENAVDQYQKEVETGNKTEFDSLFNAISAESSIVVAAAQHHTNVVVHAQKWIFTNGTEKYRYHTTSSQRPLDPQLLTMLEMQHEHVLALRVMFGSDDISVVEETGPVEWQRIFGMMAAMAALLDISSRLLHYVITTIPALMCCSWPKDYPRP